MAKEKKLGPHVTYHDLAGDAPVVTVAGVRFEDGDKIDLVEEIGENRAEPVLAKLAGNHFFDVEGSDADRGEIRERVAIESGRARRNKAPVREPKIKNSVKRRLEKEDAEDSKNDPAKPDENTDGEGEGELPDDVKTPETATLEQTGGRPRLPRARK